MERTTDSRDFSSTSPSARWMIYYKGYTGIPFAKEVAVLLEYPNEYVPDFKKKDFTFWASTLGLERRYMSINQLLDDLSIRNILELSSGYSFRGLDYTQKKRVHYIDTDLPEIISVKNELIKSLIRGNNETIGNLEVVPLNALDRTGFRELAGHFPQGEIAIVNEGLLTYLNKQEKEKLCSIIHDILTERGGYWITADIALKNKESKLGLSYNDEIRKFNEQHDTESNSFESIEEAEMFFKSNGFIINKIATVKYSEMSSFKYLKKSMTIRHLLKMRNTRQIFATWRLKAV